MGGGLFQEGNHTIAQEYRIGEILQSHRPIAHALHIEEVCLGTGSQKQIVESKFDIAPRGAECATNAPDILINRTDVGFDELHMPKSPPHGSDNVTRGKFSGSDFVQHECEQGKVFATDQQYFDIGSEGQRFIKVSCGAESGEPPTRNDDPGLFPFAIDCAHGFTFVRPLTMSALPYGTGSRFAREHW